MKGKGIFKPLIRWFYGSTGSGKTRQAYEDAKTLGLTPYTCMATTKWWEGYDAHEYVIIDDMRKDFCKFHDLLRMLDRYPYLVECKGGSRQLLAKTIIITTTHRPEELYSGREDINQLLRRIDEIRLFGNNVEYHNTLDRARDILLKAERKSNVNLIIDEYSEDELE